MRLPTMLLAATFLSAGIAPPLAADLLVSEGQLVNFRMTKGPLASGGKNGDGRFKQSLRGSQFGPAQVIAHDAESMTFRGPTTTCKMFSNQSVVCENGSSGTWR